jgi:hypothetical protein
MIPRPPGRFLAVITDGEMPRRIKPRPARARRQTQRRWLAIPQRTIFTVPVAPHDFKAFRIEKEPQTEEK